MLKRNPVQFTTAGRQCGSRQERSNACGSRTHGGSAAAAGDIAASDTDVGTTEQSDVDKISRGTGVFGAKKIKSAEKFQGAKGQKKVSRGGR